MLETLLDIGNVLRINNPIDTYRYFKETPKTNNELKIQRKVQVWSVTVDENFDFDVDNAEQIVGNAGKYFTFRFKTTEADNIFRYVCGDIYYSLKKKQDKQKKISYEESSAYRTTRSKSKSCFENIDNNDLKLFLANNSEIGKFRDVFSKKIEFIETFLYDKSLAILNDNETVKEGGIVLHFDFVGDENGKNWFERNNQVEPIKRAVTKIFFDEQNGLYVLNKSLHHAISSHQEDSQFPNFARGNQFKTRGFTESEAVSLFHSIKFIEDPEFSIKIKTKKHEFRVIILPRGNNKKLSSNAILDFFSNDYNNFSDERLNNNIQAEKSFSKVIKKYSEPLLERLTDNIPENIRQFDLIFVDASGKTIFDSIELSGVERSLLTHLREKVKIAVVEIEKEREKLNIAIPERFGAITVANSLRHLMEIPYDDKEGFDEKKYHAHLLKTFPKIYSKTYYRDPVLLNWLIEHTEVWIRNAGFEKARENFMLTKFDWSFLNKIQIEGEIYMKELLESDSYNIGIKLGELCRPISWKKGSFTATHAGMLTRRVSTIQGLLQFILEVEEIMCRNKLATSPRRILANELVSYVKNLEQKDYDKYFLGFGFFESYFKKLTDDDKVVVDDQDELNDETE